MTPFGPYSLLRKIATGGTAEIFLARRHGVDGFARHLAIKRILPHLESEPAFIQLLLDEARIAAHLHHGHIIPIHEVGVEDGQAYIAMEYLPGTDLGRLMRAGRRRKRRVLLLTADAAWRESLAEALAARLQAEVVPAADRAQAFARSSEGPLDLAVIDTRQLGPTRDPLLHELQAAHPEMLRTVLLGHGPGRKAGCYAVATELVDPTLVAAVAQQCLRMRMPLELSVQIVRAVAEALDYAHQATDFTGHPLHVVHRDVNPSNILVSLGGVVKLVDFGIAKATIRVRDEGRGNFVGTVNYMSPEQTTGQDADPRSDQFALGTVFYELAAGRHPFAGENEFQTMRNIQARQLPSLSELVPGIPEELSALTARAMQKVVGARYDETAEMASAIEELARREGLNLSPRRLARYLEVVYTDAERASLGLSGTGYPPAGARASQPSLDALALPPRTPVPPALAPSSRQGGRGPRRAIEIDVDLDDSEEMDALETLSGDDIDHGHDESTNPDTSDDLTPRRRS